MEFNGQNNGAEEDGSHGYPFPILSRSTVPISKEKNNYEEESSVYPGNGYGEPEFIGDDKAENVDVEVAAQNTCNLLPASKINNLIQGGSDQKMKVDTSTVKIVSELPTGGFQKNSEDDSSEEWKSDTACASVGKSFYDLKLTKNRTKFHELAFQCTSDDVGNKDLLALSTQREDKMMRSPVQEEHTETFHTPTPEVQSEITESASQTSRTSKDDLFKLDADLKCQLPCQLIEMQVPKQGSQDPSARTSSTCTVDLLTIIFLQLILKPAVMTYLKKSPHDIYKEVIPRLFDMFIEEEFDQIRLEWANLLPEPFRSLDFFGEDRDVILPPFHWKSYLDINQPTDTPIPSGLLRIQSCVELVPPEGRLNLQILGNLLQEAFYHETRENADPIVLDGQGGAPPPLIIGDFTDAQLDLINVESLHGFVNIGPYRYFVGGFSSLYDYHYTARIYSYSTNEDHVDRVFTYDNYMELLIPILYTSGDLTLVFLFRDPTQ